MTGCPNCQQQTLRWFQEMNSGDSIEIIKIRSNYDDSFEYLVENILNANDFVANENRKIFSDHKIFCINIMAAPGAGKTALIVKTIALLKKEMRIGVIEGDTASVTIDSDKVTLAGAPAVQVTTMGECHMDAMMVRKGMEQPFDSLGK